jgi:4-hydroxybenzoate polyprenyltransferase
LAFGWSVGLFMIFFAAWGFALRTFKRFPRAMPDQGMGSKPIISVLFGPRWLPLSWQVSLFVYATYESPPKAAFFFF